MIKNKRTGGKLNRGYGMTDYYFYFLEDNNIKFPRGKYNDIISDFNSGLINLIIEDNIEYNLPYINSTLSVRKKKFKPQIIDGKLINNTSIDWVTTNKLWSNDEEAREKKILVRFLNNHTSGYVFRIYFRKHNDKVAYKNKGLYYFKTGRKFARQLAERIKDETKDNYNAYLLYNGA